MTADRREGDEPSIDSGAVDAALDGRALRRLRTYESIVEACRQLMLEGILRPDSRSLATRSQVSHRTLFWHFPRLQDVYRKALEDSAVASAIERRIPRDRPGILRAVVLGEVSHDRAGGALRDRPTDPPDYGF